MSKTSPSSVAGKDPEYLRLRKKLLADPDAVCGFCGGPNPTTIDHIIPAALGGTNDESNLRPAHASCNKAAGAKLGNRLRKTRRLPPKTGPKFLGVDSSSAPRESVYTVTNRTSVEILPYGGRIVVFRPFIGRFELSDTPAQRRRCPTSPHSHSIGLEANLAPDQGYPVRFTR